MRAAPASTGGALPAPTDPLVEVLARNRTVRGTGDTGPSEALETGGGTLIR